PRSRTRPRGRSRPRSRAGTTTTACCEARGPDLERDGEPLVAELDVAAGDLRRLRLHLLELPVRVGGVVVHHHGAPRRRLAHDMAEMLERAVAPADARLVLLRRVLGVVEEDVGAV